MQADAEVKVLEAELAADARRRLALERAWSACRRAVKAGKLSNIALPGAYRAAGTCEWLRGNAAKSRELWQRSLDEAERMDATFEAGVCLLEIGRRLRDRKRLEQAETVLAACGAEVYRRRAVELLIGLDPPG